MSPGHRRAATLATLLLLAVLPTAFSGDSITQLVQDQTYVGVGFDTLDPGPHTLTMTLQATGANNEISSSWAWDPYGWVLWTSNDSNQTLLIHQWTANGVLGEDVATPQFDGTTTQPAPLGGWFTVSVSHVDIDLDMDYSDPNNPPMPDDETEATTGVGMPITFNGPDLPASFPLTEEAGRNLWVAVTSDAGGTLHFEGTGAQLEVYQLGATGWEKVTGGIPVPPGGLYDTFVVHTSNQFTGPVMLKARLDHGT
ncbi:MAG: hypothetical protein ACE5KM_17375, partial [Planctomycetaceae bacterium]